MSSSLLCLGAPAQLQAPGTAPHSRGASLLRSSFLGRPQAPAHVRRAAQRRISPRAVPVAKVREIFMPALSSTMTEGKIVSWSKR